MRIEHFEKKKPLNSSIEDFVVTTIDFDEDSKRIVSFSIMQVYLTGENKHEIIRFDTAHGARHVHRFYKRLDHKEENPTGKEISRVAFDECRKDIEKNWKKYKAWYIAKWLT